MLHTCLLAIPKGPFIEAILFQRVGYDKFLPELIVPTGSSEPPMLKDQAVVTSKDRCGPGRTIGVGMPQICSFPFAFGFLRPLRDANASSTASRL